MNCQECGYELWNLSQPSCPECATDFDLRSYKFAPNTVGFGCPTCGHLHGGAGHQHIPAETDEATCLSCGAVMRVRDMPVVPLDGDTPAAAFIGEEPVPWVRRKEIGFWRAWWQTCVLSLKDPEKMADSLSVSTGFGGAYLFAAFTGFVTSFTNVLIVVALYMITSNAGQPFMSQEEFIINIASPLIAFVSPLIYVVLMIGPAHLFFRASGGCRGDFDLSIACGFYGTGPYLFALLPLWACSSLIAVIWGVVVTIILYARAQGVGGLRATVGYFLPVFAIFFVSCCGITIIGALLQASGGAIP